MNACRALTLVAILAPLSVSATDLPVSYLVQQKPLKVAVAGTVLTFGLYSDSACTKLVQSVPVNVEDVTILSKLAQVTPKRDKKLPSAVEIRMTLKGVTPSASVYLKVLSSIGAIVPLVDSCQVQASTSAAAVPAGLVLKDSLGAEVGIYVTYPPPAAVLRMVPNLAAPISVRIGATTGFFDNATFYFSSEDCSGTPLVEGSQDASSLRPLYETFFHAGTLYYSRLNEVSQVTVSSRLDIIPDVYTSAEKCDRPGDSPGASVFVPPDGCCCTKRCSGTGTLTGGPFDTLDMSGFVPPFHLER